MPSVRNALSNIWTALNPKEPSAQFLAAFMAGALLLFGVAILIGYH